MASQIDNMAGNTLNAGVASVACVNAGSDDKDKVNDKIKGTLYRLRNLSYQQANVSQQSNVVSVRETDKIQEEEDAGSLVSEASGQDSVMGSMEDISGERKLLHKEEWHGKNTAFKLDSVHDAVNKMYNMHLQCLQRIKPLEYAVFDPEGGILPQLTKFTSYAKDSTAKQSSIEAENAQLRDEMEIVKGVISKQSKQIATLQKKLADQTARSMADCIVIGGLLGDSKEAEDRDAEIMAAAFLEEELEIPLDVEGTDCKILSSYRLGRFTQNKHRPVVIKVSSALYQKVFSSTTKLSDKYNAQGRPYSVNPLLPDSLSEQRREIRQIIKEKKDSEKGLPKQQKSSFLVRNGSVFINGQKKRKSVKPPEFHKWFVDEAEQLKINKIRTKTVEDPPVKGSKFRAVSVVTPTLNDVHLAYIKMFQTYPHADHVVVAYSAEGDLGFHDDGEFGAGYRILNIIKDSHLRDVSLFVIREYGGEHLGPARFDVMKSLAAKALEALG